MEETPILAARLLMPRPSRERSQAFTLLELIAVIVVIGLISVVGMTVVSGHLDQAELIRVSQSIVNADRKERDVSRQSPVAGELTIERSRKRLRFRNSGQTISLGSNVNITETIVRSSDSSNPTILFSQSGQSESYAVRLQSRRGASKWILILGISGQVLVRDSSDEVRSWIAMGDAT
jgi:prepilin-type N-terminal cleavage/methylation domain-containing protein